MPRRAGGPGRRAASKEWREMRCFYINLDAAAQRRRFLEANFAETRKAEWSLTRIAAIDAGYIEANEIGGSSTPAEKGCFLSHKKALRESMNDDEAVFILEDDAMFGSDTCNIVEQLPEFAKDLEWDIVFTDAVVPLIADMSGLVTLRHELDDKKEIRLINLKEFSFAGSTAYIVKGTSKKRLLDVIDSQVEINEPYDLFLRKKIHGGEINGLLCFPFITSTSELSFLTSIQDGNEKKPGHRKADLIWDLFRKLTWIERDMERHRFALTVIDQSLSEEDRAFGILWAAQSAKGFEIK
jgi:GR25 family glycosyltransferase involved in LPS biosynthesis